MNIKTRLTIQFGSISAVILALALLAIYILSEAYREEEYYERLVNRSVNLATLLIEVDEIDEMLLYRIERDNPIRLPEEAIKIYNFKNEVIFDMDDGDVYEMDTTLLRTIRLDSMITYRQGDREFLGLLFTSRYDRFVITASAIDIYGNRKIKNLRNVLFVVFGLGMIITFLTARFFAFQAMRPVQHLIGQVEELTPTDLSVRLSEARGTDEIAAIAQAFNAMLGRVEDAFRTQKNFIANASHEMRTPLTAITGQLEVLALRKRSVEEYERTLHSVIEDIHRLNRLANRLLLLAQTETDVAEANFQRCRIDEIIWTAASDVQKFKPDYQVSITFGDTIESDDQLTIWGSEVLLKSVIVNLMENGCKYAEDNCVELHLTAEPRQLLMVVTDRGIGIPDADIGHIFQPFFRGSNVEQRQGHGIGLSLVHRIIALHRGSISISSQVGKGTVVSVRLPLATL